MDSDAKAIFEIYGYDKDSSPAKQQAALLQMLHDGIFKMSDWIAARSSKLEQTFAYNFDQVATTKNTMEGWSHHAIDLHYLFMNRNEDLTPELISLAKSFSGSFIDVAYGKEPWARFAPSHNWMVFGPDEKWEVKSEVEQASIRPLFARCEELHKRDLLQPFIDAVLDITFEKGLKKYALEGGFMLDRPAMPPS